MTISDYIYFIILFIGLGLVFYGIFELNDFCPEGVPLIAIGVVIPLMTAAIYHAIGRRIYMSFPYILLLIFQFSVIIAFRILQKKVFKPAMRANVVITVLFVPFIILSFSLFKDTWVPVITLSFFALIFLWIWIPLLIASHKANHANTAQLFVSSKMLFVPVYYVSQASRNNIQSEIWNEIKKVNDCDKKRELIYGGFESFAADIKHGIYIFDTHEYVIAKIQREKLKLLGTAYLLTSKQKKQSIVDIPNYICEKGVSGCDNLIERTITVNDKSVIVRTPKCIGKISDAFYECIALVKTSDAEKLHNKYLS